MFRGRQLAVRRRHGHDHGLRLLALEFVDRADARSAGSIAFSKFTCALYGATTRMFSIVIG